MNNGTENTYHTPISNLGRVDERIDQINRRAARLGLASVGYVIVDRYLEERRVDNNYAPPQRYWHRLAEGEEPCGYTRECVEIKVVGEPVVIDGWRFIAHLEHTEAGNLISRLDGDDSPIGKIWRKAPANCAHCQQPRSRKYTYLVRSEDGDLLQVGSTCVQDFLQGHDPEKALRLATAIRTIRTCCADEDYAMGGRQPWFGVVEYLGWVAGAIRVSGWLSRGKARLEGGMATADYAEQTMLKFYGSRPCDYDVTEADAQRAAKAIAYVKDVLGAKPNPSDYEYNLIVAVAAGSFKLDRDGRRKAGLVASAIVSYERHAARELARQRRDAEAREAGARSTHVGNVGDRLRNLPVILTRIYETEGHYGARTMHRFEDEAGNVYVWWATGEARAETGDQLLLTGTVKRHSDYRGTKQTDLQRCILREVQAAAA